MKAFHEQFQAPSRQQWMEKAEKELKGKPLDALSWEIDQHLTVPPVFFQEDMEPSFTVSSQKSNWTIGDKYLISDPAQTNKDLLAALEMGLEGAHLIIDVNLTRAQWAILFDKVILSYITLVLDTRSLPATDLSGLAEYLQDSDWNKEQLIILSHNEKACPEPLKDCLYIKSTFSVTLENSVQALSEQLKKAEVNLQASLKNKFVSNKYNFQLTLSSHFYLNVIYTQALNILWQNILDANGIDPHTPIFIQGIISDQDALDENTQKINATIQAVSAVAAGVDFLQIETSDKSENKSFNRRINRNIQHLLKLESYMDYVENPSAGAYYFDTLTKEFAEKVWVSFTET